MHVGIQLLLDRLGGVQVVRTRPRMNASWKACCPLHDDRHPSLDIDLSQDNTPLMICRVCGGGKDIAGRVLDAIGMTWEELQRSEPPAATARPRIVATFPYHDASGTVLYESVRVEPGRGGRKKEFFQRRPSGGGRWVNDLEGVERVLYRLPALRAAAPSAPVFVPEGEAKVEALLNLGLVATCNVGGAKKWLAAYTQELRGRNVILLPDNDESGREHVQLVRGHLDGAAASIKVLTLPGLPPKGDIIDWLKAGGTKGQLLALAEALDDGWREPIPLAQPDAGVFPLDVLPRELAEYADAVAVSMPCPVDLVAVACLVAAATAIGTTRQVRIKSRWVEGPRLWCAIVCDTGTKKSPALAAALEPLFIRQRQYRREHQQAKVQHEQAVLIHETELARYRRDAREAEGTAAAGALKPPAGPEAPRMRQVLATDTTVEALAGVLEANPRGILLASDELTGWVASENQYKTGGRGNDRQKWLSFWTGADVVINRKSGTTHISDPLINVVGCLPPDVLGDLQDEEGREDGFVHRILFAWPEPLVPRYSEIEPHPDVIAAYRRLFDRLLDLEHTRAEQDGEPRPITIGLDREARALFADFVNRLGAEMASEGHPDNLRGPWAKLDGYCARLALVLHVCRQQAGEADGADVDAQSMAGAIRLVEYFQAHARRVYPRLAGIRRTLLQRNALAILGWVQRNEESIRRRGGQFRWRDVRHDLHSRFDDRPEDLKEALAFLEDRGFVEELAVERAGSVGRKPQPSYSVNPRTWCANSFKCSKSNGNGHGTPISGIKNYLRTMPEEKENGSGPANGERF